MHFVFFFRKNHHNLLPRKDKISLSCRPLIYIHHGFLICGLSSPRGSRIENITLGPFVDIFTKSSYFSSTAVVILFLSDTHFPRLQSELDFRNEYERSRPNSYGCRGGGRFQYTQKKPNFREKNQNKNFFRVQDRKAHNYVP